MQNIALFVNRDRDIDLSATKEVISLLQKYNKTVYIIPCFDLFGKGLWKTYS